MDDFLPATQLNRAQRRISAAVSRGRVTTNKQPIAAENGSDVGISTNVFDVSEEDLTRRLGTAVSHMREVDYFSSFSKVLDEAMLASGVSIDHIVCYGLGSFGSSMTSRYQLAFLTLLKEKLGAKVEIFDPTFTPNEIRVMGSGLGFKVLEKNEEGQRVVDGGTVPGILFYMPHAPHQLVNNLLYANWVFTSITKCICICNSFTNLKSNSPKKGLGQNLGYIDRSEKIVVEYGIINTFPYKDIFNDMALHSFPRQRILEHHLPKEYWERSLKPSYPTLEFIPASVHPSSNNRESLDPTELTHTESGDKK